MTATPCKHGILRGCWFCAFSAKLTENLRTHFGGHRRVIMIERARICRRILRSTWLDREQAVSLVMSVYGLSYCRSCSEYIKTGPKDDDPFFMCSKCTDLFGGKR